jgi:hypothetical protein
LFLFLAFVAKKYINPLISKALKLLRVGELVFVTKLSLIKTLTYQYIRNVYFGFPSKQPAVVMEEKRLLKKHHKFAITVII